MKSKEQQSRFFFKFQKIPNFTYAGFDNFSISSGILTSVDGAVLLARTQNVTKTRRFCVAFKITKAVLNSNDNN